MTISWLNRSVFLRPKADCAVQRRYSVTWADAMDENGDVVDEDGQ